MGTFPAVIQPVSVIQMGLASDSIEASLSACTMLYAVGPVSVAPEVPNNNGCSLIDPRRDVAKSAIVCNQPRPDRGRNQRNAVERRVPREPRHAAI